MPNAKLVSPTIPVVGRVNSGATTLTPGRAVIAGGAEDQVQLAGAAAAAIKGVVALDQNAPQNSMVSIHAGHGGMVYVEAGAAFAADVKLATDATGRFVLATTGQAIHAISRGAAAAAGDLIAVERMDGLTNAP